MNEDLSPRKSAHAGERGFLFLFLFLGWAYTVRLSIEAWPDVMVPLLYCLLSKTNSETAIYRGLSKVIGTLGEAMLWRCGSSDRRPCFSGGGGIDRGYEGRKTEGDKEDQRRNECAVEDHLANELDQRSIVPFITSGIMNHPGHRLPSPRTLFSLHSITHQHRPHRRSDISH